MKLMYNRRKEIPHATEPVTGAQKRVRNPKNEVAGSPQNWVRFWRKAARHGGSQNWVRRRNGYVSRRRALKSGISNAAAQNWVRKWNGRDAYYAELGTQGNGVSVGKPECVPNSAGITTPECRFTRYTWRKALGVRRNGYAFGASGCGKACGNRELSTQKPVRALR